MVFVYALIRSDFYVYDIESNQVAELSRDTSRVGGPDPGFTQRATLDLERDELYVFSGLMKEKNSPHETVNNCLWVYALKTQKW